MSFKGVVLKRSPPDEGEVYLKIGLDGAISWVVEKKDAYQSFTDLLALWMYVLSQQHEYGVEYSIEGSE